MGGAKRPPFGWGGVGTRRKKDSYKCCRIETRNDLATVGGLPERQWNLERLEMIFLSPGDAEGETSEKLEFDDPLNENAMFLRSQGLQHEAKMVPKRAEKRKKSREEGKGEQRSAKHLHQSVQRCHKSTVQNGLRQHPEISGIPGGAFGTFLDDFLCY